MSFRDGPRSVKAADGDSAYATGNSTVLQAVQQIQQSTADIRKQTGHILGGARCDDRNKGEVEAAWKCAQKSVDEAERLLEGFFGGDSSQKLKKQKLTDALAIALGEMEAALQAFGVVAQDGPCLDGNSTATSSLAAGAGLNGQKSSTSSVASATVSYEARPTASLTPSLGSSVGTGVMWPRKASAGLELNAVDPASASLSYFGGGSAFGLAPRQALLQDADVSEAEVDLHTAVAAEYSAATAKVAQEVRGLQRVMLDISAQASDHSFVLDNIESNMLRAHEDTEGANRQLLLASNRQRRNTKYVIALLVVAFIVAAIVIFVVIRHH